MKKIVLLVFLIVSCVTFLSCAKQPELPQPEPTTQSTPIALDPNRAVTSTPEPTKVSCLYPLPPLSEPVDREPATSQTPIHFRILHINDFHTELIENIDVENGEYTPGAARVSTVIDEERSVLGAEKTLLFDAGDWSEGGAVWMKISPFEVLDFYKKIGVNALTIGNHEFYNGADTFVKLIANANGIAMLSANFRMIAPEFQCFNTNKIIDPYHIFEIQDDDGNGMVRLAVIGLGFYRMETISLSDRPIVFEDPIAEVRDFYKVAYELEKPDIVVLLTHMEDATAQKMAETLNAEGIGPDLIIGGHSHSWLEEPIIVGDTTIVTAGYYGRALGILDLTFDRPSQNLGIEWQLRRINGCVAEDEKILASLKVAYPDVYSSASLQPLQKYKNAEELSIRFEKPNEAFGLWVKQEPGDDGTTIMVEKAGEQAITNAEGSNYIYINIPPPFTFCQQTIMVEVEYFDEGYGPLMIEYDRAPLGPKHPCEDCYFPKLITNLGNTKTWKTANVILPDASFNSNQKWGTDFRLTGWGQPIFLKSLVVRKVEPTGP